MADNTTPDPYGNYQDRNGLLYQTPDGKPAGAGTSVTIAENTGGGTGTFIGDTVHKD